MKTGHSCGGAPTLPYICKVLFTFHGLGAMGSRGLGFICFIFSGLFMTPIFMQRLSGSRAPVDFGSAALHGMECG